MAQSEAQLRASKKYHERFDDIKVRVPKGERKRWQEFAAAHGLSLNFLIIQSVLRFMHEVEKKEKEQPEDA